MRQRFDISLRAWRGGSWKTGAPSRSLYTVVTICQVLSQTDSNVNYPHVSVFCLAVIRILTTFSHFILLLSPIRHFDRVIHILISFTCCVGRFLLHTSHVWRLFIYVRIVVLFISKYFLLRFAHPSFARYFVPVLYFIHFSSA